MTSPTTSFYQSLKYIDTSDNSNFKFFIEVYNSSSKLIQRFEYEILIVLHTAILDKTVIFLDST